MMCEPNYVSVFNRDEAHIPMERQNAISYQGPEVIPFSPF
jgi:hypothetical protein